ncbi:MAG: hypothetical protein IT521_07320 [Burkholderiales bacterium]|nr:hypothetical protein [Burkholderiales bacterium]
MRPAHPLAHAFVPIAVLTLIWGCNWPVLKLGIEELAPLTFRAFTLPFAALGLLLIAYRNGDAIRVPREWWPRLVVRQLLRTRVASSPSKVAKLCTGVPSSSVCRATLASATLERLAGATGSRVASLQPSPP